MSITKISLVHKTAADTTITVLVSSEGQGYTSITPRENLGNYVIDVSTHETKLTKYTDVIEIGAGAIGSYIFNFKVDTSKTKNFSYPTSLSKMLQTDWLKSKLAVKYVGKGRIYLLSADLKTGVESKESVSLDF